MKRIIALVACMLMFAACIAETELVNPATASGTLEEVTEACDMPMCHPAVMGVTDEQYTVYRIEDTVMGEYSFKLAGYEWTLRAAKVSEEDISGVYIDGAPAFAGAADGIAVREDDGIMLARWFANGGQYVLSVEGDELPDISVLTGAAEEIQQLTCADESGCAALEGFYWDDFSMRATLEAVCTGSVLEITVDWSSAWDECTAWKMTAELSDDGRLVYSDCRKTEIKGDELTEVYQNGEGYFTVTEDGRLAWDGAAESDCAECVFSIPE